MFSYSIIIAIYNGEKYIESLCESLLPGLLQHPGGEIVLVDDSSTDRTRDFAISIFEKATVNIVKITNKVNCGPFRAFMKGLEASNGEIIFFCDQDDYWYPDKIDHVLQVFAENPAIELVCHPCNIINGQNGGANCIRSPSLEFGELFSLGCCLAFRGRDRDLLIGKYYQICEALGYSIGHDRFISLYYSLRNSSLVIPSPLIDYIQHDANYSRRRKPTTRALDRVRASIKERYLIFEAFPYREINNFKLRLKKLTYVIAYALFD